MHVSDDIIRSPAARASHSTTPRTPLASSRACHGSIFSELLCRLGNEHINEVAALHAQIDALTIGNQFDGQPPRNFFRNIHVQKRSPVSLKPLSSMQATPEDGLGDDPSSYEHAVQSHDVHDATRRRLGQSSYNKTLSFGIDSLGKEYSEKSSSNKASLAKLALLKPWAVHNQIDTKARPSRYDHPHETKSTSDRSRQSTFDRSRQSYSHGSISEKATSECPESELTPSVVIESPRMDGVSSTIVGASSTQKASQRKKTNAARATDAILSRGMLGQMNQLTREFTNVTEFRTRRITKKDIESWVDYIGGAVIMLNVIQIGVSTDLHREWKGWFVIDGCIAIFFLLEMVIKMILSGGIRAYFCGRGATWNFFDAFIVVLAMFEIVTYIVGETDQGGVSLSFLRAVRLCRLARLTRLLRFSFFKELKLMVMGLFFGARTLFWSFVLVLLPLYPLAIILRETLGTIDKDDDKKVQRNFQTIGWSWFTIFRCIMGDCNDDSGKPIFVLATQSHSWAFAVFYCAVIMFSVFGLFNVIIAIYVENVMDAAKNNDVIQKRRRLVDDRLRTKLTTELVHFFIEKQRNTQRKTTVDRVSRGSAASQELSEMSITKDVFEKVMADPEAQKLLDRLDISDEDRFDLFEILDADCSGEIEVHELVMGILKLRGSARRGDVVACRLLLMALQDGMQYISDEAREDNAVIVEKLEGIASQMRMRSN